MSVLQSAKARDPHYSAGLQSVLLAAVVVGVYAAHLLTSELNPDIMGHGRYLAVFTLSWAFLVIAPAGFLLVEQAAYLLRSRARRKLHHH